MDLSLLVRRWGFIWAYWGLWLCVINEELEELKRVLLKVQTYCNASCLFDTHMLNLLVT